MRIVWPKFTGSPTPGRLPNLGDDEGYDALGGILMVVESPRATPAKSYLVSEIRTLVENIGDDKLETEILQIIIGRRNAGLVTEREIESYPRRFIVGQKRILRAVLSELRQPARIAGSVAEHKATRRKNL